MESKYNLISKTVATELWWWLLKNAGERSAVRGVRKTPRFHAGLNGRLDAAVNVIEKWRTQTDTDGHGQTRTGVDGGGGKSLKVNDDSERRDKQWGRPFQLHQEHLSASTQKGATRRELNGR